MRSVFSVRVDEMTATIRTGLFQNLHYGVGRRHDIDHCCFHLIAPERLNLKQRRMDFQIRPCKCGMRNAAAEWESSCRQADLTQVKPFGRYGIRVPPSAFRIKTDSISLFCDLLKFSGIVSTSN